MLNSVLSRITAATGHAFSDLSPAEEAVGYLVAGGWWAYCTSEHTDLQVIVGEEPEDDDVFALLTEVEPDLADRARAVASAAHARIASDDRSLVQAARLWHGDSGEAPPDATVSILRAEFPEWGWQSAALLVDEPVPVREVRLALALPDGRVGQFAANVVESVGADVLLPDPRAMMFARITPEVREQLAVAWTWATNQDRFVPGRSILWTVQFEDHAVPVVGGPSIGATAAVALSFALDLAYRTKATARKDGVLLAGLAPSGVLEPVPADTAPQPAGMADMRLLLSDAQPERPAGSAEVVRVATVGEAVDSLRRPRRGRMAVAAALVCALVGAVLVLTGNGSAVKAEKARRDKQADTLAVLAMQSRWPDEAIRYALAAMALGSDRQLPQDSLTRALYGEVGLEEILPALHGSPKSVALSSDLAATGSDDGTVGLRNLAQPAAATTAEKLPGAVRALAFSPDSRWLAAAGGGEVLVYDAKAGRTVWRSNLLGAAALAFSPDSASLAVGGDNGAVLVHSLAHTPDQRLSRGSAPIRAVALLPGGALAVGGDSKTFEVLGIGADPPVVLATAQAGTGITSIAFDTRSKWVAFSEFSGDLHTFRLDTLAPVGSPVRQAIGARLITAPGGGSAVLSAAATVLGADRIDIVPGIHPVTQTSAYRRYPSGAGDLGAVAISPDGQRMAIPSASGSLLVWRAPGRPDMAKARAITGAYPVPGTGLILVASGGGDNFPSSSALLLVDRASGRLADSQPSPTSFDGAVDSPLSFEPSTRTAVVRDDHGAAHVYQVRNGLLAKVADLTPAKGEVTATAFDPSRRRLLVARGRDLFAVSADQFAAMNEVRVYQDPGVITQLQLTADGRELAVGGRAGVVVLPLDEHGRAVGAGQRVSTQQPAVTAMSQSGALIAAGAAGTMTAYRLVAGQWTGAPLPGHGGQVTGLATYGDLVVSGGRDRKLRVFDLRADLPVVATTLPVRFQTKTLWRDGPAVVSSGEFPATSTDIVLDPVAAQRKACAMGGWDRLRTLLRDVAPSVEAEYGETVLCRL
ncbi:MULTISPECIES: WD40 repeat domain-containing protein [Amycolatopsis]|uniref:WD40 repeat domain-containing protein n=1 Tax=Amycolatopsis albidoflavus TaxID=102226 RepID=A0ABW5I899_9PSEU